MSRPWQVAFLGPGPLLHRGLQCGPELSLVIIQVAVGLATSCLRSLRAGEAASAFSPQCCGGLSGFLKINSLPLVSEHELPVGPFQNLHPETGIAGPVHSWQQLQDPPVVLHHFLPAHLAGVPDADRLGERRAIRHQSVSRLGSLRRHGEPLVETQQEFPEYLVGLLKDATNSPPVYGLTSQQGKDSPRDGTEDTFSGRVGG